MLCGLQERNSKAKTWFYHVKRLLCVNGFGYVWMYGEVGDERRFLHILKNGLNVNFASISVGGHIYLTVNASIFIIVLKAHFSVKDI